MRFRLLNTRFWIELYPQLDEKKSWLKIAHWIV